MNVVIKKTNFLIKSNFPILLAYASAYYLACLLCYKEIDSQVIKYRGFKYFEHDYYLNFIYFFMAIVPIFFLPTNKKKISSYFFWLAYSFIYVPLMILTPHFYEIPPHYVFLFNSTFLFSFILMIFIVNYDSPKLNILSEKYLFNYSFFPKKNSPRKASFDYGIVGISFLFSCILIYYYGFRDFSFLDFTKTYEIRADFHDLLTDSPLYLKYVFLSCSFLLAPLLVTLGFIRKNYVFMILGTVLTFYLCSISAQKTTFFFIFLQLFTFMLYKYAHRYFYIIVTTAPFSMLIVSVIIDRIILKGYYFYALFTSRLIPMHASLTHRYLDYFMTHDFFYLKESSLVRYIFGLEAPLRTIPYTIGMTLTNNPQTSANENFWVEAFANFGFGGIVIYSVIVALILKLIDIISLRKNFIFSFVFTLYPISVLFSGSLPSALLSGGLLLAIIILYFLDTHEYEPAK